MIATCGAKHPRNANAVCSLEPGHRSVHRMIKGNREIYNWSRSVPMRATVQLKAYPIIQEAVERGVCSAMRRLNKHQTMVKGHLVSLIENEMAEHVMLELCEVLDFPEPL